MKKIYIVALLLTSFNCQSQTPDWVWARSAQSATTGAGEGWSVAVDKQDNVFICGRQVGSITFGSNVMNSNGASAVLAKYDRNGNVRWAKNNSYFNNTSQCFAQGVSADGYGNSYITGYYIFSVTFGSNTLATYGNDDIFVAKYDSTGNELWAKGAGGSGVDIGYGIASDPFGNTYVTGVFTSASITFGTYTLTNTGFDDIFLVKYDSAGNVLWAKSAAGSMYDYAYGVTTDASGNAYITGYFGSTTLSFGSHTISNSGSYDVFLAKYDSAGNALWARSAAGLTGDYGWSIAADSSANIYITGVFGSSSLSFGSHTITSAGGGDGFLAKYDSSGNSLWAKDIGGTLTDKSYTVAADKFGRAYVSGYFASNPIMFDTVSLPLPNGQHDPMFVAAYDSSGHAQWAKALPSGGDDNNSIAVGPAGCIYVGGDFYVISPFIIGHDSLILSGIEDIFVAKLCPSGLLVDFTSSNNVICSETNNCINFTDYSTGNPTSWQWLFPGAFPGTSSLQNPTNICYSTPGTYPVTLIVSDGTVTDTLTVANMIRVGGTPQLPVISIAGGDTLVCSPAAHYQWYLNGNVISGATDSFYVALQYGVYSVQITDGFGCSALSNGLLLSVEDVRGGLVVTVFPNPADDQFTVYGLQFTVDESLQVYNMLGERVLVHPPETENSKPEMVIDVSSLSDGIYFLKISSERLGTMNKKFVVMHK